MPLSNSTTLYFLPVFVFKKDMINSDISVVLKPQIYSIFDIYKKVSNFKKVFAMISIFKLSKLSKKMKLKNTHLKSYFISKV